MNRRNRKNRRDGRGQEGLRNGESLRLADATIWRDSPISQAELERISVYVEEAPLGPPPPPKPMRADARRNYERIVATARAAFAELGPDVPLDTVARRAGVGPGTLYRHFPTRDALVEAVYRTDIAELAARAAELAGRHAPGEALERWVREHFVPAQEQPGVAATMQDALARSPEVFSQYKEQFSDAT